jgi:hypothetical protein
MLQSVGPIHSTTIASTLQLGLRTVSSYTYFDMTAGRGKFSYDGRPLYIGSKPYKLW